jgi:hypothetical protein
MAEMQELDTELSELEVVSDQIEDEQKERKSQEAKPVEGEDIPEEFRGKSVAELVRIAQHARREMGKQGNELGEVRKLADELLKSHLYAKPEEEKPKEVDFFENPQEAIRQAVESNPRVLEAEQYAQQARMAQAKQALVQKHPDFADIIQDGDFADWIKASKIRTDLYRAAEAYNVDAADELFSTYKALKGTKQRQVTEADKTARDKSLKAAAVDTGGSGEVSRKVYRRDALRLLQIRDPRRFAAMKSEIDAAYAEGRVR